MDKNNNRFNRRFFIQSQAGLITLLGLGGVSQAAGFKETAQNFGQTDASWKTATAGDFSALIGQTFMARDSDKNIFHLKLKDVVGHKASGNRPKNLRRSQSLSLIFSADNAGTLAEKGHQNMWVWGGSLGESELFLGAIPLKNGGYEIELVLG